MDVSTFAMPSSSSSWDTTNSVRAASAPDESARQSPTNGVNAAEDASETQEAALFTSPVIGVDPGTGSTILEYRNQSNGVVTSQVPSQVALQYAEAVASSPVGRSVQQIEASGAAPGGNVVA